MPSNQYRQILINNIIEQAKYYLEDAGEFYPFGTVISNSNLLKPVSGYFGEDTPDSIEVVNYLEEGIKDGIAKGIYLLGAIGIDILIPVQVNSSSVDKRDALEIRLYQKDGKADKVYFLYSIKAGIYEFVNYDF